MPKKEKTLIILEKFRIEREKARFVLDKAVLMYLIFMAFGAYGFINGVIDQKSLNWLIILGIMILIFASIPYLIIISSEEKKLKEMLR